MSSPLLVNIHKAQIDYLETISKYKSLIEQEVLSAKDICLMLDDIKLFWLNRIDILEFELEQLTEIYTCFLLCGAIYLNVKDNEHYYFKTLGDYHLLADPFLRMEGFFRVPKKTKSDEKMIAYIKRVYADTIEILSKYRNAFLFLPIREMAVRDEEEHQKLLNKYLLGFLSDALNKELANKGEFYNSFKSYEEIENAMDSYIRDHMIFSCMDDIELPLRERVQRYCEEQPALSALIKNKSEPEIFLILTHSWISQILDILLNCVYLRVNPYIRFDITFHYFTLVMYTFLEDKKLKAMMEKTIIFYILYKTIEESKLIEINFEDYCKRLADRPILNNVIDKMHEIEVDIFKGSLKKVEAIIIEEIEEII